MSCLYLAKFNVFINKKGTSKMKESEFYKINEITEQEVEILKKRSIHKMLVIPTVEEMEVLNLSENFDKYGRFLIYLSNHIKHYCSNRVLDDEEKRSVKYINNLIYENIEIEDNYEYEN